MKKANKEIVINGKTYAMKKSKFAVNYSPIHISDSMSGKMSGIPSISTSCIVNPICIERMKDGNSICSHCFASATIQRYTNLGKALESNFNLLNESILPDDLLPIFCNVAIVRIESFGDVASINQAINYLNIVRVNPSVTFAWWSKNMPIIAKAIEIVGKPSNLVLVESSEKLNTEKAKSIIADKVFTVYDKKTIAENAINVNCGARCCATCRRCYSKSTESIVNEELK